MFAVTILDGGMGGELIRRGAATVGELWSAQALIDAPVGYAIRRSEYVAAVSKALA